MLVVPALPVGLVAVEHFDAPVHQLDAVVFAARRLGDQLLTDDLNPQSTFRPNPLYGDSGPYEAEFSTFVVPDCTLPQLAVRESLSAPAPPAR